MERSRVGQAYAHRATLRSGAFSAQERHVPCSNRSAVVATAAMRLMLDTVGGALDPSRHERHFTVVGQHDEQGIRSLVERDRLLEDGAAANALTG